MKRVLIVEDEEDIRDFIVINLKRAGFEVVEAESGEEALAIIQNEKNLDIML
jgi:DNA-binding response OmpR family regulator